MKEYHLTADEFDRLDSKSLNGRYIIKDLGKYFYRKGILRPAKEGEYFINGEYFSSKEEYEIAFYLYKNQLENYQ